MHVPSNQRLSRALEYPQQLVVQLKGQNILELGKVSQYAIRFTMLALMDAQKGLSYAQSSWSSNP